MNNGVVEFNGERFTADNVEYTGNVGLDYDGDMFTDEFPVNMSQGDIEHMEQELKKQSHLVTVHTSVWLDDCGDLLCSGSREFTVCSNDFDIRGNFGLEGVAKEKGKDSFEYMFMSHGDVEYVNKGAF